MGRVYSLTMLYNLNTRKHGRHTGQSGGTHTTGDIRDAPINLSGIRKQPSLSYAFRGILKPGALNSEVQRSVRVDEDIAQSGVRPASSTFMFANLILVSSCRRGVQPWKVTASFRRRSFTQQTRPHRLPTYEIPEPFSFPVVRFSVMAQPFVSGTPYLYMRVSACAST